MTTADGVKYYLWPSPDNPYLLARVHWPDVFQAMSPVLPDWQYDPGLFDLPYDPSSTPVTIEKAAEVAAEWGGRLPTDENARPLELMRRMPADWSNLSRAEKKAWSIEFVKPGHLITPPQPITGRLPVLATAEVGSTAEIAASAEAPAETEVPAATPESEPEAAPAIAASTDTPATPPNLVVSLAASRRSRRPWRRRRDGALPAGHADPAHDADVIQMADGREAIVHLDLTDTAEDERTHDRTDERIHDRTDDRTDRAATLAAEDA